VVLVAIRHLLNFLLDLSQLGFLVFDIDITLFHVLLKFAVGLNESVFEGDQLSDVERKHFCEVVNLAGVRSNHRAELPLMLSI
jgi:hypothetical protein